MKKLRKPLSLALALALVLSLTSFVTITPAEANNVTQLDTPLTGVTGSWGNVTIPVGQNGLTQEMLDNIISVSVSGLAGTTNHEVQAAGIRFFGSYPAGQWTTDAFADNAAITITWGGGGPTITIDPATYTLATPGLTRQLTATADPPSAAAGFTWTSNTPAVATVNSTGLVTAVADGTAEITATATNDGTLYGTATITVGGPIRSAPWPPAGGDTTIAGHRLDVRGNAGWLEGGQNTDEGRVGTEASRAWASASGVRFYALTSAAWGNWCGAPALIRVEIAGGNISIQGRSRNIVNAHNRSAQATWDALGAEADDLSRLIINDAGTQYGVLWGDTIPTGWRNVTGEGPTPVPPSITTHPISQSITAGNSAIFTVAATGTPTPTIQWQTNAMGSWTNIDGAAGASHAVANAQLAMNGHQFRAVATNTAGSEESNAATLTVTAAPVTPNAITLYPPSTTLTTAGAQHTFTATVLPAGAPQGVTWETSNMSIAAVADGVVTAVGNGTATITARAAPPHTNVIGTATVVVNITPIGGDFSAELVGNTLTIRFPVNRVPADANGITVNFSAGDLNFTAVEEAAAGTTSSRGSIAFPAGAGGTNILARSFRQTGSSTAYAPNFLWVTPADGSVSFATNTGTGWVDSGGGNWQHDAAVLANPNVSGDVEIVITNIQGAAGTVSISFSQFGNSSHLYPENVTEGLSHEFVAQAGPPVVTTTAFPAGTVGTSYNQSLQATNSPTSWTVTLGSLPGGLSLTSATGVISGTPNTAGTFDFSVTATNAHGTSSAQALSITINTAGAGLQPEITHQPRNRVVTVGNNVSINATFGNRASIADHFLTACCCWWHTTPVSRYTYINNPLAQYGFNIVAPAPRSTTNTITWETHNGASWVPVANPNVTTMRGPGDWHTGTPPYSMETGSSGATGWSDIRTATSLMVNHSAPGSHRYRVRIQNGAVSVISDEITLTVNPPPAVQIPTERRGVGFMHIYTQQNGSTTWEGSEGEFAGGSHLDLPFIDFDIDDDVVFQMPPMTWGVSGNSFDPNHTKAIFLVPAGTNLDNLQVAVRISRGGTVPGDGEIVTLRPGAFFSPSAGHFFDGIYIPGEAGVTWAGTDPDDDYRDFGPPWDADWGTITVPFVTIPNFQVIRTGITFVNALNDALPPGGIQPGDSISVSFIIGEPEGSIPSPIMPSLSASFGQTIQQAIDAGQLPANGFRSTGGTPGAFEWVNVNNAVGIPGDGSGHISNNHTLRFTPDSIWHHLNNPDGYMPSLLLDITLNVIGFRMDAEVNPVAVGGTPQFTNINFTRDGGQPTNYLFAIDAVEWYRDYGVGVVSAEFAPQSQTTLNPGYTFQAGNSYTALLRLDNTATTTIEGLRANSFFLNGVLTHNTWLEGGQLVLQFTFDPLVSDEPHTFHARLVDPHLFPSNFALTGNNHPVIVAGTPFDVDIIMTVPDGADVGSVSNMVLDFEQDAFGWRPTSHSNVLAGFTLSATAPGVGGNPPPFSAGTTGILNFDRETTPGATGEVTLIRFHFTANANVTANLLEDLTFILNGGVCDPLCDGGNHVLYCSLFSVAAIGTEGVTTLIDAEDVSSDQFNIVPGADFSLEYAGLSAMYNETRNMLNVASAEFRYEIVLTSNDSARMFYFRGIPGTVVTYRLGEWDFVAETSTFTVGTSGNFPIDLAARYDNRSIISRYISFVRGTYRVPGSETDVPFTFVVRRATPGNVDDNSRVDASDITMLRRHMAGNLGETLRFCPINAAISDANLAQMTGLRARDANGEIIAPPAHVPTGSTTATDITANDVTRIRNHISGGTELPTLGAPASNP